MVERNGDELDPHFMKGGATTLILAVLARQPMHGYQLTAELGARSDGIFAFAEGTVYPLLYGLEEKGLVSSSWEAGDGGRRKKVYAITAAGKKALARRMRQWSLFSKGMELVAGKRRPKGSEA